MRRFVRAAAAAIGVFIVVFGACMAAAQVNFGWIAALRAPTLIVNWVNLPTGAGELTHSIVGWFGNVQEQPFDNMFRFIGIVALVVVFVLQWWRARAGGPDAVRRMGITLLVVAVLAPPTLPWYLTWGLAIFGATPWRRSWMAFSAALAVLILLVYYPNGEAAMGDLLHMIWVILAAILTGAAVMKVDPLGLRHRPTGTTTLTGDVSGAVPAPDDITPSEAPSHGDGGSNGVVVSAPAETATTDDADESDPAVDGADPVGSADHPVGSVDPVGSADPVVGGKPVTG
jgi:hypothetical protein